MATNQFLNMEKTLIVDADSIAFAAALQELDVHDKIDYANNSIKNLLSYTGCKDIELYFTIGRNSFRYALDKEYKSNRKSTKSPEDLTIIKQELNRIYPGELCELYEADDAVVWRGKQINTLVAAMDKDVLGQLPGEHFNYHHKHWCYEITTEHEAKLFLWVQMIQGDPADGIYGITGMGKVRARKYLEDKENYKEAVWSLYKEESKTKKEFLTNLNLLDMNMLNENKEVILNEF